MKQTFYLIALCTFTIISFYSCSNDDNTTIPEPSEPEIQRYISTFKHIQSGNPDFTYEHTFLYNEDKSIKEIIWEYYLDETNNEIYNYRFSYDANKRINKVEQYLNGELLESETSVIAYDENGFVNQIGAFPVTYNAALNTYTVQTNTSAYDYKFNDEQDIVMFNALNYEYDINKKGAGHDTQNQLLILLLRSSIGSELVLSLSKRPLINYSNGFVERNLMNEYDDEGYLTKSTEINFNDVYEFTYVNL